MSACAAVGVLREYIPVSWFHPKGIYRVLARLEPRLPDVSGKLFLTFTTNPALHADPLAAFEHSRDRLRRIFFRLRRGIEWKGKQYVIDAPYAVKLEFHKNGWAHFHVVFLTRHFLPGELLNELWGLGRTNVRRISNRGFRYLLKYVTKGGRLPEWALGRSRLRAFQSSRGFLFPVGQNRKAASATAEPQKRRESTLGDRLKRWERTALLERGEHFEQLVLVAPFFDLMAHLIFPIAREGRYLGGGRFQINDPFQLLPWIT